MAFRKGFTLTELTVVILILGILAVVAVPNYTKSVESGKAGEARSRLQAIAMANRMNYVKTAGYTSGQLSASHPLVIDRLIPNEPWASLPYLYYSCNNGSGLAACCSGNNAVACAQRRDGKYPGWGYQIKNNGECYNVGGAPSCPSAAGNGCTTVGGVMSCR